MVYCTNCGAMLPDGSSFCTTCGAQLAAAPAPQQPQYQPQPEQPQYAPQPQQPQQQYYAPQQPQAPYGYQQQPYGYQPAPAPGAKSRMAAGLLAIFLGALGVHNFYLGNTGKAIAQLLITVLTLGFGAFISGIWALIEGILILTKSINTDANGVPLTD
ncbi:MAG: TM2 domain-containing protein [Clostridium sp.]|jgi:TM2 domain-containing membrane protein YozV|nr:TM2 domain-containing protein [Clostridium sp.]